MPTSGPIASAGTVTKSITDATRHQCPRTSRALRRSGCSAAFSEHHHLREQRPADEEERGDQDPGAGEAEQGDHEHGAAAARGAARQPVRQAAVGRPSA